MCIVMHYTYPSGHLNSPSNEIPFSQTNMYVFIHCYWMVSRIDIELYMYCKSTFSKRQDKIQDYKLLMTVFVFLHIFNTR